MTDLDDIMLIITDITVMQWTSRPPVKSRTEGSAWLSARALGANVFNFAIRERGRTRVVGLIGSFHWPSVGYMVHPDFKGKGYATEALKAFILAYFERVPRPGEDEGVGYDVLEGFADTENFASQRVLEKSGFTRGEVLVGDVEGVLGVRDTVVFRIARPGCRLVELGFGGRDEGPPFEPPVQ